MNKEAIKNIIEKIIKEDSEELSFYRSFSQNSAVSGVLVKRMNESLYNYPSTTDTIICLHLYPAIKWVADNGNVYDIINKFSADEHREISQLSNVQKIIQNVIGMRTELKLNSRELYLDACQKFVIRMNEIVTLIGDYPHIGKKYQAILKSFLGMEENPDNSTSIYYVNKNAQSMLCFLNDYYGDVFEESLNELLSGRAIADDEANKVYHNIELLLKEYNKIVWHTKHSKDKAMQLLSCSNAMEMDGVTQNDSKYFQASIIVDYIKFIRGAIDVVRSFPVMGDEYYKILLAIIKFKSQCLPDREIARFLSMSTYSYSVKRKKALAVLSAVLWGVDGDVYVKMLTDK